MTTLTTWLAAIAGAAIALILTFIQGRLSGAKAEHNANLARESQIHEKHLQEIADAAAARNAVDPDCLPDSDIYRRD